MAGEDSIIPELREPNLARKDFFVVNGNLVLGVSGESIFGFGGPQNTANHIGHGTTSVGAQNPDSNKVGGLGGTVLARTDGSGTVGSVVVAVLVDIVLRDGLAPRGATLEDVVDIDVSINYVHVNATTGRVVLVESESSESEFLAVGNARKTLRDSVNHKSCNKSKGAYPWCKALGIEGMNNGILLGASDL